MSSTVTKQQTMNKFITGRMIVFKMCLLCRSSAMKQIFITQDFVHVVNKIRIFHILFSGAVLDF